MLMPSTAARDEQDGEGGQHDRDEHDRDCRSRPYVDVGVAVRTARAGAGRAEQHERYSERRADKNAQPQKQQKARARLAPGTATFRSLVAKIGFAHARESNPAFGAGVNNAPLRHSGRPTQIA